MGIPFGVPALSLSLSGETKNVPSRRDMFRGIIDMETAELRQMDDRTLNIAPVGDETDPALLHREDCWDFIMTDAAPWHRECT